MATDSSSRHRRASRPRGKAYAHGRAAEDEAARHLEKHGFDVRWRNLRLGYLELDIVALKDDLVVVVEVRSRRRNSVQPAIASLSHSKRQSLLRAVELLWIAHLAKLPHVRRVRIDLAAVTHDQDGIVHLEWIAGALTEDASS